jgi:hypothetical protein
MPFWKPGSLTEEESWQVTAFLLRENDLWDGKTELSPDSAANVKIPRGMATAVVTPQQAEAREGVRVVLGAALLGIPILLLLLLFVLKKSRNTTTI